MVQLVLESFEYSSNTTRDWFRLLSFHPSQSSVQSSPVHSPVANIARARGYLKISSLFFVHAFSSFKNKIGSSEDDGGRCIIHFFISPRIASILPSRHGPYLYLQRRNQLPYYFL